MYIKLILDLPPVFDIIDTICARCAKCVRLLPNEMCGKISSEKPNSIRSKKYKTNSKKLRVLYYIHARFIIFLFFFLSLQKTYKKCRPQEEE